MKEQVLVIGGAGYLGSVLVDRLLEKQYPVKILDNFIYGKRSVEKYNGNSSVEIIEGDIRNIETVNKDYIQNYQASFKHGAFYSPKFISICQIHKCINILLTD